MGSEHEIIRVGKELDKVVQHDPMVSVCRALFSHSWFLVIDVNVFTVAFFALFVRNSYATITLILFIVHLSHL